jgi:hypothetical protein
VAVVAVQHLVTQPVLLLEVVQAVVMVVAWAVYILAELGEDQENLELQVIVIKVIFQTMVAVVEVVECFQEPVVQDEIFQINPMEAALAAVAQPMEQMALVHPVAAAVTLVEMLVVALAAVVAGVPEVEIAVAPLGVLEAKL